jgi:hypothetical protein
MGGSLISRRAISANVWFKLGKISWKVTSILVVFAMLLPGFVTMVEVYAAEAYSEDMQLPLSIEDGSVVQQDESNPTPTPTETLVLTEAITPTLTLTSTATATPTITLTSTPVITPTVIVTPTVTATPTITPTEIITETPAPTPSPTITPTIELTQSLTITPTLSPTIEPTLAPTETISITDTEPITESVKLVLSSETATLSPEGEAYLDWEIQDFETLKTTEGLDLVFWLSTGLAPHKDQTGTYEPITNTLRIAAAEAKGSTHLQAAADAYG